MVPENNNADHHLSNAILEKHHFDTIAIGTDKRGKNSNNMTIDTQENFGSFQ